MLGGGAVSGAEVALVVDVDTVGDSRVFNATLLGQSAEPGE